MPKGYSKPLYILAFDHRGSFRRKMFGITGDATPEQAAVIAGAKGLIFGGFLRALERGAPKHAAGILVDEESGSEVARRAKREGVIFAMPVEKTGRDEFEFEYGEDFAAHIEEFDPTFAKALVRLNPEGDAELNERQASRLTVLSRALEERGRPFMFELLVPPTPSQLVGSGGDLARYDAEIRPGLMIRAIADLQAAGVEPDVWKIEGIDAREGCERISAQVRSGGRDDVACVVLGRGADEQAVVRWLKAGAGVPGFVGFAVGRTIWWNAVEEFLAGTIDRERAIDWIAGNYCRMIEVYESAG